MLRKVAKTMLFFYWFLLTNEYNEERRILMSTHTNILELRTSEKQLDSKDSREEMRGMESSLLSYPKLFCTWQIILNMLSWHTKWISQLFLGSLDFGSARLFSWSHGHSIYEMGPLSICLSRTQSNIATILRNKLLSS